MERKNKFKTVLVPLLAAAIWGAAFAFQRKASVYLETFTFNAARSYLAVLALSVFIVIQRRKKPEPPRRIGRKRFFLGGTVCGALLFAAAALQQAGLETVEAGKAGFITTLYVVLVPLFSLMLGKKVNPKIWISVALALTGLFLLCVSGGFSIDGADLLILACAVVYGWYIVAVDYYVRDMNPFVLSCQQFMVSAVLNTVAMILFEQPTWQALWACAIDILYVGVMSSAVAYSLQFVAQKASGDAPMTTIFLSMESVFSVLFGAIILKEYLTLRELVGCAVMFVAVLIAQLNPKDVTK